jgi:predicted dehydrogenase
MTVKIGFVGLGNLGDIYAGYAAEMDGVDVVAGVDVAAEQRERFESTYGAPAYESVDAMLDGHDDLDAANIVSPHTVHHAQASSCLDAGLDVHLEKPMATTVEDAVDLVERAEARDLVLQIGYQRHLDPSYREVKRIVEEGRIGEVHSVSCHLGQNWLDLVEGNWRMKPELSGGGQFIDSGSHLLDVLLWTTDSTPRTVTAVLDDRGHDVDVNSAVAAILDGPDGQITASIGVTGDGHQFEEGLYIWGTDGYVAFEGGELTVAESGGETYTATPEGFEWPEVNRIKLRAFVEAVRGEREVPVEGEDGLRVTALTEAAYRAAERGEAVDAAELVEMARSAAATSDD